MTVRPCELDDIGHLVELAAGFHELHRDIAPDDYCPDLDRTATTAMFAEVTGSSDFLLAVADAGRGNLAGYVWGQIMDRAPSPFTPTARFLFVHQLFVAPEWRRLKVASALLEYASRFAAAHGAGEVFLDTVISNGAAIDTFSSCGFRGSGVVMRRRLAA